jgi:hypothetical protein
MGQELMFDQYAYSIRVKSDKPQETKEPKKEELINMRGTAGDSEENLNLDDFAAEELQDESSAQKEN